MNSVAIIRQLLNAAIARGPNSEEFRKQLESRELDKRVEWIGPEVFDPSGFARAAIAARDFLEFAEEL